jgi:choline dehydrogenase-like flavoprotein
MSTSSRERPLDENLPEGSVVDGEALASDHDEELDFVVVGSGAAGSVAAHVLVSAGWTVGLVEEGPWVRTRDFKDDVLGAFRRTMRDNGTQVLKGRVYMPMLQGRCVGGSTVVNSAIAWRIPEDVVDDWRDRFGLGSAITMKRLEPHFDALERDLSVRPVSEEALGESNRLFLETCARSGIEAKRMHRYDLGCKGSGQCITGCPNAAKQGMNVSYIPWALATGRARLFASTRCERVEIAGGRAVGVAGKAASGKRVTLRARHAVFVAASTVQTPNVLRRSGLRSRAIGRHFQAHPGLGMGGLFDRPIRMNFGATQGAESIAFRKRDRFKLETIGMPPELAAARIPMVGAELSEKLAAFANVAVWVAQVRMQAEGRVDVPWYAGDGRDRVTYTPTEDDMRSVRKAIVTIARLFFDAGAREIWPGVHGVPSALRSHDDVHLLENATLEPRAYSFIATHLFGAARMGPDPRTSVVGLDFQSHEVERLYVIDSSVFPTNLGVNPQHTIMALAREAAMNVAARATRTAAA